MTVPYSAELPVKFSSISWFRTVVLRWRGGVFKLLIWEVLIVMGLWYIVNVVIRSMSSERQAEAFTVVKFMRDYQSSTRTLLVSGLAAPTDPITQIPVTPHQPDHQSFMLVYYYQQIYARAKSIFFAIPWPDNPFFMVSCIFYFFSLLTACHPMARPTALWAAMTNEAGSCAAPSSDISLPRRSSSTTAPAPNLE